MGLAESAGVQLSYGAVRRYMDVPRAALGLINSGEIGELRHISIESGGGELLWAHPHNFDLITYFTGVRPVGSVQARLTFNPTAWSDPVLDADPRGDSCDIHFAHGPSASISVTGASSVRIACDRAELVIGGNTSWLQETPRGSQLTEYQQPNHRRVAVTMSGRRRALEELATAVRGGTAQCHTPQDILRSNELGLACAWSAVNDGRAVELGAIPPDFRVTGRKGDLYA